MQRNLHALANTVHDILILGGGIYGAAAAWEASLRGLSVALIDKSDWGAATSSNSLKIIHGGLRYLQHADFKRMRESIRERAILMRIAPHLVHPLPCVMPTYGHAMKGKEAMAIAMFMNDLIGFDRNGSSDPQKHLPPGRIISKRECLEIIPGLEEKGLTGGAVWHDCQVYNSERMLLSYLHSASRNGAQLANYVEVTGFMVKDRRVLGVKARDVMTQNEFEIRARLVINNTGPWVNETLGLLDQKKSNRKVLLSKAMNLVLRRQIIPHYAVGVPSKFEFQDRDAIINKGSRLLFIRPWREVSIIGTTHVAYHGEPKDFRVTESDIQAFVDEVSAAYPAANLSRRDVAFFNGGLLPMESVNPRTGDVRLVKHYILRDHEAEHGLAGLLTVVGVKYTTARDVAAKSIDLAVRKLRGPFKKSAGASTPIHGGNLARFNDYLQAETQRKPHGLSARIVKHLVENYGAAYNEVLQCAEGHHALLQPVAENTEVLRAEIIHGIREEMALKLSDVVMRRTELGSAGNPGEEALQACAKMMAEELQWKEGRVREELAETEAVFVPARS
jgi:glycerol-3-phosphate dehydrogenase